MSKNYATMGGIASLILILFWLYVGTSWITNLVKFVDLDFKEPYKAEIIRGVGIPVIFLPCITAFADIGEENK